MSQMSGKRQWFRRSSLSCSRMNALRSCFNRSSSLICSDVRLRPGQSSARTWQNVLYDNISSNPRNSSISTACLRRLCNANTIGRIRIVSTCNTSCEGCVFRVQKESHKTSIVNGVLVRIARSNFCDAS